MVSIAWERQKARSPCRLRKPRGPAFFSGKRRSPIDPRIESPKEIRDHILEAARYIPMEQLGTIDDRGFSPLCDDTSTTREKAFAKIRSRVEGTALAEDILNGS